jgi:hypothetical protein
VTEAISLARSREDGDASRSAATSMESRVPFAAASDIEFQR